LGEGEKTFFTVTALLFKYDMRYTEKNSIFVSTDGSVTYLRYNKEYER
jgi:hypothetical protein